MTSNRTEDYIFPKETVETILLKRSLTNKKFLGIMSEYFESRWFEGNNINTAIMKMAIVYLKKANTIPNIKTMIMMSKKYCQSHQEVKQEELEARLMELSSFTMPDEELVMHDLEKFIFEQCYYYAVSDSVKDIHSIHDVSKIMERFDKINKIMLRDDNVGLNYFTSEGQDSFWDFIVNPEAKISTGWPGLDHITHGGFLKDGRMLALFVGQPGLGKSLFLSNIAVNFLEQNKSVVVISLEMSEYVYCSRFASIISGDNINRLNSTCNSSREKVENFYKNHPNANLIVKEYPPSSVRVVDIEHYLDKLVESGTKIDVIVVDYLNLVLPNTKEDNMYMSIKKVSEQLRSLSYKFNAPVISATQANRDGTNNERIDLTNISESTGQSQTADWIGLLWRSEDDISKGNINMRVAKNRFGEPGRVLHYHLNTSNLKLMDITFDANANITDSEADKITSNLDDIKDDLMDI